MARKGKVSRKTKETSINVEVNIDGKSKYQIDTGIGFLDRMLEQLSEHSLIDLKVKAKGDTHIDLHHTTDCLLYTSPSPRDRTRSRMPSSA